MNSVEQLYKIQLAVERAIYKLEAEAIVEKMQRELAAIAADKSVYVHQKFFKSVPVWARAMSAASALKAEHRARCEAIRKAASAQTAKGEARTIVIKSNVNASDARLLVNELSEQIKKDGVILQ